MFFGKSKRVIVIKDIHSNLFEEAILVLKEDNDKEQCKKISSDKNSNIDNNFILKEAELIINNYIKDNKSKFISPKKNEALVKNTKFMKNLLINSALLGSVAAVVFLLVKLF
ncbi:MAG TPA: hypothetical protein VIK78_00495 [Ruminiclostridium sp.]